MCGAALLAVIGLIRGHLTQYIRIMQRIMASNIVPLSVSHRVSREQCDHVGGSLLSLSRPLEHHLTELTSPQHISSYLDPNITHSGD